MGDGEHFVIDLCSDARVPQIGVYGIGEVQDTCIDGERNRSPLGGEGGDVVGIEAEVDGIEELHTLGVGMVQYLTDRIQPDLELVILLYVTILVPPVSS